MFVSEVKYNFKDFDNCINNINTSKRFIEISQKVIGAIYGPLDYRISTQNGKLFSEIVDKMTEIEEDFTKITNYCKSVVSEYEKLEAQINKELGMLENKNSRLSKVLTTPLYDMTVTLYANTTAEEREAWKKELEEKRKKEAEEEKKKKKKKPNCVKRAFNSVTKKVKSVGNAIKDAACDFGDWMIYEPVGEKWKDIKHLGKSAGETVTEVGRKSLLTGCNACSGFTWGLAEFGEGLLDGLTYVGTGLLTPFTGIADGVQAIGCAVTGEKYDSLTVNCWQRSAKSVKRDITADGKEKYYDKNGYGDLLKEDSYGYETVNKASETVGYISGAIMTGGAGIQVGTASMAISGVGRGSEAALQSGATIVKSIIAGVVQGVIDGASYLFGAKLGQKVFGQGTTAFDKWWTKTFGETATLKSNITNVAIKTGADMTDAAANTFAQPAIQKIYRDESYKELFEQNGGYKTLATNMAIAGGLSAAAEGLEIKNKNRAEIDVAGKGKVDNKIKGKISEIEKFNTLDDFMDEMAKGRKTDQAIVDSMYKMFKDAIDEDNFEALYVLQTITELKKKYPDLRITSRADVLNSHWNRGDMEIVIGPYELSNSFTLSREFGHCLFDVVNDGTLPDNWNTIVRQARETSSNEDIMGMVGDELYEVRKICFEKATKIYEDKLMQSQGITISEYEKVLADQYSKLLKETSPTVLRNKLKQMGYADDIIDKVSKGIIRSDKLAKAHINKNVYLMADLLHKRDYGEYCAISNLIDAVYGGKGVDLNGNTIKSTYGYGSKYYDSAPENAAFREIIANFTALKVNGNKKMLDDLKRMFGDDFYNLMESVFSGLKSN